ncbi:uncharacterized protein LOC112344953 isoform X2 [Selaginella moellendorffii]|uniref:uncharacterized protein LOC112344953 isoform X2 n=1 Tax=Selaginella moellendorffii TaxID=88036 RepID=UPI000D1C959A|nr:uncharacterized protein LOC112344953 isoform X2 [Selaginella moellendorffii]|eukprot:XP_024526412.1 uncharacterized protein LOC112344953 isoform X2 [Selaginella moellendorffii]
MAKCAKIHITSGRMVSVETPDSATHARALPARFSTKKGDAASQDLRDAKQSSKAFLRGHTHARKRMKKKEKKEQEYLRRRRRRRTLLYRRVRRAAAAHVASARETRPAAPVTDRPRTCEGQAWSPRHFYFLPPRGGICAGISHAAKVFEVWGNVVVELCAWRSIRDDAAFRDSAVLLVMSLLIPLIAGKSGDGGGMICEQRFHMTFINAATSRDHPGAQARRSELPDLLPPGRRKKACELSPAWNLTFKVSRARRGWR